MLTELTRAGKPVLVNTENIAWVVPNEKGGARVVFNATPYQSEEQGKLRPIFLDMDVDQSLDEISSMDDGKTPAGSVMRG
jgi:hypothetical protein